MTAQNKWYSIRQRTPLAAAAQGVQSAAEIFIYGDIGESWYGDTITAAQFVKDIAEIDAQALTIRINSFGGSVTDGIAIHNAIKRHPASVTICVDGIAASIASLIAMAGDAVEMAENAMLMIHAPWGGVSGNAAKLREYADMLDSWSAAMATSYASKSGMAADDVLALLNDGKDHWYTAAEALSAGFANTVVSASPESASAMASFNLTRYQPAPAMAQATRAAAAASTPVDEAAATNAVQSTDSLEIPMPGTVDNTAAPATIAPADLAQARVQALAQDQARREAIRASFKPHLALAGVAELMSTCENRHDISAESAGLQLLAHIGQGATPVNGNRVVTVEDEGDKIRGAMQQAILARGAVRLESGAVRADTANPYRGFKLIDIARAALERGGFKTDGLLPMQLVAAAFTQSTSDFPILLENTMHKVVQSAYALQADTWTRFCNRGTVSDFRAHNRYRIGSLSNLDVLNELGEFKNKSIPDGEKSSITAATKGNIINISRQAIINDDLSAFTGLAAAMGRAAKRTVEADVFATLALNSGFGPTLADGLALFHASHNNIIASGTAPTVAAFEAMRVLLRAQKDVSGNDYLELSPAIWLGPDSLVGQAKVVVNSTFDPDANNKLQRANIAADMVSDIVGTPRLAGTPHFMFANPFEAPVLEVAFLDGNDTPYLELQNGFTQDGAMWKVRLDFGIAGIDYRGAVRNAGA